LTDLEVKTIHTQYAYVPVIFVYSLWRYTSLHSLTAK